MSEEYNEELQTEDGQTEEGQEGGLPEEVQAMQDFSARESARDRAASYISENMRQSEQKQFSADMDYTGGAIGQNQFNSSGRASKGLDSDQFKFQAFQAK